ncbi:2Fe-2S iron-sulfur cluster-binding protein [Pseudomonadota bacterium]
MTAGILALIILAAILAQVGVLLMIGLYRRKRQYRCLDTREPDPLDSATPNDSISSSTPKPLTPDLAWCGFREFRVLRRNFDDVNHSVCSFYLVPLDGKPLPSFMPGQFLTFRLQIENPETRTSKTVVRCYSLSDRPKPDHYRISVKRLSSPTNQPEVPPGLSSNFLHTLASENTRLMVKAPSGHFHLVEDQTLPVVLIGGGIGITPMLSMLYALLESESPRSVWLFYGVRNGDEVIMGEYLQALANTHANFHLHLCFSRPNDGDTEGVNYQHTGRVSLQLLKSTLKSTHYQFYVCGPRSMIENLVPELEKWGVALGNIHYESFGPAMLVGRKKPDSRPVALSAQSITVTFSKTRKRIPWDQNIDSLLELAEAQDIEVMSGCRAGSCGSCQTPIETGEVEYSQRPDAEVEPGHCLLCISTPKSDLTLTA